MFLSDDTIACIKGCIADVSETLTVHTLKAKNAVITHIDTPLQLWPVL
jgi:hypothetical protein